MAQVTLDYKTPNYRVYKAEDLKLPKNTLVISSEETRAVLYNPHIAGKQLQDEMEKVSVIFNEVVKEKILKEEKSMDAVEFVLLAGGLYYNLNYGFKKVHNMALPQCFLGIKRQRVEGKEGQFNAVATYENFEALGNNATVIIGDTIASGATIVRAVKILEDALEEKEYKIKNLVIISLACSTEGARRLKKLEEKIQGKMYLIVAEQLFHVMPDGTDLRFLREDTVIPEETQKYTIKTYGTFLGREMKCAVFDWGTRCKNPKKHYTEFLEFAEQILKHKEIDKKGKEAVERMKKETEEELKKFS